MNRRHVSFLLCVTLALLSRSAALGGIMLPGDANLSEPFGDFTVYSLPFLKNYYTVQGLPNPNQFEVDSNNNLGNKDPAIVIGTGPNGQRPNNQDLAGFGVLPGSVDDAESTPNAGPDEFKNFDGTPLDPDPSITNDSDQSWDISVESLTNFLDSTNSDLIFYFNLNEVGTEEGLLGNDILGWAEVSLTGAAGSVSYYLGGRNGPMGSISGSGSTPPDMNDITDPNWAYIHGYINVDDTTGEFKSFGKSNAPGTTNISQNLGADEAAFAFTNRDLQNALYSGQYDMMRIRFALDQVDNGYEQLFILGDGSRVEVVPEPASAAFFLLLGASGLGYRRFRKISA